MLSDFMGHDVIDLAVLNRSLSGDVEHSDFSTLNCLLSVFSAKSS